MSTTLRAEFYVDDDTRNWHFWVPVQRILGGGVQARDEAQRECLAAIEFALEGDPNDYDTTADAVDLEVVVRAA